jgi:hypothetical protein
MSKNKSRKAKKAAAKPRRNLTIEDIIARIPPEKRPDPRLPILASQLDFVSFTISMVVLAFVFFELRYNKALILHNLTVIPKEIAPVLLIGFPIVWGIATAIKAFQLGFQANVHFLFEPEFLSKARIAISALNITLMILSALAIFYLSGIVALIFAFFQNQVFPGLSTLTNMILANLAGGILSGLIGNFVYDLLKRIFRARSKPQKAHAPKNNRPAKSKLN